MKSILASALVAMAIPTGAHAAQPCSAPEEVTRAYVRAVAAGRLDEALDLFAADAQLHDLPQSPERLNGDVTTEVESLRRPPTGGGAATARIPVYSNISELASVGGFVFAKVRSAERSESPEGVLELAAFHVSACRISDLWRIARYAKEEPDHALGNENVIRDLVAANNAGDVERYISLYTPGPLHFRASENSRALADRPSKYNSDPEGRREAQRKSFAEGAPSQVAIAKLLSLGDLVLSRNVSRLADGQVLDEASIYRLEDGKISHEWFVVAKPQP